MATIFNNSFPGITFKYTYICIHLYKLVVFHDVDDDDGNIA